MGKFAKSIQRTSGMWFYSVTVVFLLLCIGALAREEIQIEIVERNIASTHTYFGCGQKWSVDCSIVRADFCSHPNCLQMRVSSLSRLSGVSSIVISKRRKIKTSRRKLFRIIEEGPTSHMFLIFIFKEGTRISLKVLYIGNSSSKWVAPFFSFLPCIFLSFSQFLLSLSHFLTFFYLSPISSLSSN